MKNIYLKKGIKFRKEVDYILICDCINFIDFQLPLEYFELLEKLNYGLEADSILSEKEIDVLTDLYSMSLLCETENQSVDNYNNLSAFSYNETEFFK
jgi:hypothetical protein